jgi:HK97 family phage major capsid protein
VGRSLQALLNKGSALSDREIVELRHFTDEALELERDVKSAETRKLERAFRSWLRHGMSPTSRQRGVGVEDRAILESFQRDFQKRDIGTGGGGAAISVSGGGIFVPIGFVREVDANLKYSTPMMDADVVNLVDTQAGNILPFPTDDDTTQAAELVAENAQVTQGDVAAIGSANLKSYRFSSKVIRVSRELIEDENVDFSSYLARRFASRFGRGIGPFLTTGTGSAQPTGFVTTALSAGVAVGAHDDDGLSGANTIGVSDLAALESSVDYAWRPRARWMFHASTLQWFRRAKDKQGRRMYPELNDGMLGGYPYSINNAMDQLQAGVGSPPVTRTVIAYGDFSQFVTRRAAMTVNRLVERFSDFGELGFLAHWRVDGALLQPSAVKSMQTVY